MSGGRRGRLRVVVRRHYGSYQWRHGAVGRKVEIPLHPNSDRASSCLIHTRYVLAELTSELGDGGRGRTTRFDDAVSALWPAGHF